MTSESFFYPRKMARIIFMGMEEVMGAHGVDAVLRLAALEKFIQNYPLAEKERDFPFEAVSLLQSTLEQAYGPRGGRGVALRVPCLG